MVTITTLKKRADFLRLNRGKKYVAPYFILRYAAGPGVTGIRVGYTVTTKCGNAVARNRIKRRLRALAKELFPLHAAEGTDYVFIARAEVSVALQADDFAALRDAMKEALLRTGGRA
ncbi:MAG: ribonuclease P protein component [Alphaproteobacteria bacterium]